MRCIECFLTRYQMSNIIQNETQYNMIESIIKQMVIDEGRANKLKPKITIDNFDEVVPFYKVDSSLKPNKEEPLVSIDGKRFWSPGNISSIVAPSKAGKSSFLLLPVSFFITDGSPKKASIKDRFKVNAKGRDGVVVMDTEQDLEDIKGRNYRLGKMTNEKALRNVHAYDLNVNSESLDYLIDIIGMIIESHSHDCSVVIIDQLADLVGSVNDMEACRNLVATLRYYATIYDVHIVAVIHTNKGGVQATGSLGSFLEKKSETLLTLKKDSTQGITTVEATYTRGKPIDPFAFGWDNDGLPYMIDDINVVKPKRDSVAPVSVTPKMRSEILDEIFRDSVSLKGSEIKEIVKLIMQDKSLPSGDTVQKNWLSFYKREKYIKAVDGKGPSKNTLYYRVT